MSQRSTLYRPPTPVDHGWRRSALIITVGLTAVATVVAILFLSATQLTERGTAQQFLSRAVMSLLEVDGWITDAWPELEAAAAAGEVIVLTDYPISLQLDPTGLDAGPVAVADAVADTTASVIYDEGLGALSDTAETFRLVSQGAAFDGTVGQLTTGGHTVATIGLIVSGTLAIFLAMATSAQASGHWRIGMPAIAICLGAVLVWILAMLAGSAFEGRAESALDPFAADLWLLAADAVALIVRNAGIVALCSGVVVALSLAGSGLLRVVDSNADARVSNAR